MCTERDQARMRRIEYLLTVLLGGGTPRSQANIPSVPTPGANIPNPWPGWPGANPPGAPGNPWPGQPPGGQPPGSPCGGPQYCPPDLVSPDTAAAIKAGPRTGTVTVPVAGLAANGGITADVLIASNGLARSITLKDLVVPGLTNLDDLRFQVYVGGILKVDFNGGVFSRGNANGCTTACGYSVCLGPIETAAIRIINRSSAAIGGTVAPVKLDYISAYAGEPGYACPPCIMPDGSMQGGT